MSDGQLEHRCKERAVDGAPEGVVSHKANSYPVERRSQTLVGKLLRAERMIEAEIRGNGGAYPHNDGVLTQAELCRRAGVALATLQGSAQATTIRLQVDRWLRTITESMAQQKERVAGVMSADALKNDVGNRTGEWKTMLEQIAMSYDTANVEVATLRKRVEALKEREDALAKRHANLNATFSRKTRRESPR